MEENGQYSGSFDNTETIASKENKIVERVSIGQLRHLVHLLDGSDVSEIEVDRAEEGLHLVMRKAQAGSVEGTQFAYQLAAGDEDEEEEETVIVDTKHAITAPLVGIFHVWSKPKGKALVEVGDLVKVGQSVGTIQSLNVLNEVETNVAGRVVEIMVQDGQAVEYGQQMMIIESAEEA